MRQYFLWNQRAISARFPLFILFRIYVLASACLKQLPYRSHDKSKAANIGETIPVLQTAISSTWAANVEAIHITALALLGIIPRHQILSHVWLSSWISMACLALTRVKSAASL